LGFRETTKQVDRINLRTYGWATRHVYGPSKEILTQLHERADEAPKLIRKKLVMLEDHATADPVVADANAARGWPRYIDLPDGDGALRRFSYELIDTDDDARKSVAPRGHEAPAALQ
jgi:hypothetical protein